MKTNPNDAAFANNSSVGLTKLEYFAGLAMQGMLANSYNDGANQPLSTASYKQLAAMAVMQAKTLIDELNEEQK